MKPVCDRLAVVTATVDPLGALECFRSWQRTATYHLPVYVVWSVLPAAARTRAQLQALRDHDTAGVKGLMNTFSPGVSIITREGGGVVPAFAQGVAQAFAEGADVVACFHDDLEITTEGWDAQILGQVDRGVQFLGFGGARSLGAGNIYQVPYEPMQLARGGFVSNMRDAEAHGQRVTVPTPVVCFDGFSQIGTRGWFGGAWARIQTLGVQHHFYDGMLGCLAARCKTQPGLLLPIACHHYGGRTAVASEAYQAWAKGQDPKGDQGFWEAAHRIGYEEFRDVLPLRVEAFL